MAFSRNCQQLTLCAGQVHAERLAGGGSGRLRKRVNQAQVADPSSWAADALKVAFKMPLGFMPLS